MKRLVTWNINGLGSLRWPFHIHAYKTLKYPQHNKHTQKNNRQSRSQKQQQQQPHTPDTKNTDSEDSYPRDDFDEDETIESISQGTSSTGNTASTRAPPSSTPPLSSNKSVNSSSPVPLSTMSPFDPLFPAFPSASLLLPAQTVSNYVELLNYFNADILCFQEVKISRSRLDLLEKAAFVSGYDSFFSFSRRKQGYSGVVTYTRQGIACPINAEEGVTGTLLSMSLSSTAGAPPSTPIGFNEQLLSAYPSNELREIDSEGRCVITDHGSFLLFNVYVPNAGEDRNAFKLKFLSLLYARIQAVLAAGRQVIIVGDLNIAATRFDHCFPEPFPMDDGHLVPFEQSPSRTWLSNLLGPLAAGATTSSAAQADQSAPVSPFIDLLRYFYPQQQRAYTQWNQLTGARGGNHGSRIDYILSTTPLVQQGVFTDCRILSYVEGSDHCPVRADVDQTKLTSTWQCATTPPALASLYWAEFAGQQKKLSAFFHSKEQQQQPAAAAVALIVQERMTNGGQAPTPQDQTGSSSTIDKIFGLSPSSASDDVLFVKQDKQSSKKHLITVVSNRAPKRGKLSARAAAQQNSQNTGSLRSYFTSTQGNTTSKQPTDEAKQKDNDSIIVEEKEIINAEEEAAEVSAVPAAVSPSSLLSFSSPASSVPNDESISAWNAMLTQSSLSLSCPSHGIPCRLFTVNKRGPNHHRQFFCCALPPPDRCNYFVWYSDAKRQLKRAGKQRNEEEEGEAAALPTKGTQHSQTAGLQPFVSARTVMTKQHAKQT